jgi:hypothetical protein
MKTAKSGKKRSYRDTSQKSAIKTAKVYGVDISALKMNLRRTPFERMKRHQFALNTLEMLRKAKRI